MSRADLVVALCFVAAGVIEAATSHPVSPGLLVFDATGSLWLGFLAVRRTRPVVTISVLAAAAGFGTVVTQLIWPDATESGGVWLLALMLAAYSLGAHAAGRVVPLGVLLPALVVSSADIGTRTGWDRVNGMLFVTVFIGLLPTTVGRAVRVRRGRLAVLHDQHEQIARAQRARQESATLAERLRVTERLQPTLVAGLRSIAAAARTRGDPAEVETTARQLLARTRAEVVALTAPLVTTAAPELPPVDHLPALRAAAQRWAVLAAGAVVTGLYVETTHALTPTSPAWVVLPAALLVGAPAALAWWRPLTTAVLVWAATSAYSHLVAPLAGTLTETAIAVSVAFGVGALSRRRAAIVGLLVCWVGQLAGVVGAVSLGDAEMLLACWLGGVAVNEACGMVERARATNKLLAVQGAAIAEKAVVDERLRLAREIHDAIGHSLTVVALQAGAARRMTDRDPERAREVMRTVAAAAEDGSTVLEHGDGGTDVATLVDRVRAAGVDVRVESSALALLAEVPGPVVVRIVQEGLTNAIRHAPGARVTVSAQRRDDGIELVLANSAPTGTTAGPGTGRGLTGIRHRLADAAAGQVSWGPVAGGGFAVRALLLPQGETAAAR